MSEKLKSTWNTCTTRDQSEKFRSGFFNGLGVYQCYDDNFLRFLQIFGQQSAVFLETQRYDRIQKRLSLAKFIDDFFGVNPTVASDDVTAVKMHKDWVVRFRTFYSTFLHCSLLPRYSSRITLTSGRSRVSSTMGSGGTPVDQDNQVCRGRNRFNGLFHSGLAQSNNTVNQSFYTPEAHS
jgi:hypothetical protein